MSRSLQPDSPDLAHELPLCASQPQSRYHTHRKWPKLPALLFVHDQERCLALPRSVTIAPVLCKGEEHPCRISSQYLSTHQRSLVKRNLSGHTRGQKRRERLPKVPSQLHNGDDSPESHVAEAWRSSLQD